MFEKGQQISAACDLIFYLFNFSGLNHFSQNIPVNKITLCIIFIALFSMPHLQSQSDGESHRSNMEKDDTRSSPSPPSTPSICSPTSTASSVPSTGKNVCASCGLEILDRYLLKVRGRECAFVCVVSHVTSELTDLILCFDLSL